MSKSSYFFRIFGVLERVPWWLMKNLMDFPILLLTILSAVASNEAFGAFLQIIIDCIAIPAQFAPFFDRTLDFNSKLFLDEFAHFKVIGDKTVTKLRGFHENKELLRFFISTMNESFIFQS